MRRSADVGPMSKMTSVVDVPPTMRMTLCRRPAYASVLPGNQENRVKVLRWDRGDLSMYYSTTGQMLQGMYVPYDLLTTKCDGHICSHLTDINSSIKGLLIFWTILLSALYR